LSVTFGEPDSPVIVDTDSSLDTSEMLGRDSYEWTAPDKSHKVSFGRPRGNASYKVAKVLGETQSANITATIFMLAMLGIKTLDREPVDAPYTEADFVRLMERFGTDSDHVEEWRSPDGSVIVKYGSPRGAASYKIAKILGQNQSANIVLTGMLMATLAVRSINGEEVFEPANEIAAEAVMQRFGETEDNFNLFFAHLSKRVSDGLTKGSTDANLNDYVSAWQNSLHADTAKLLAEAAQAGETPEALERIAKNAGMQTANKSRARRGSMRSSS